MNKHKFLFLRYPYKNVLPGEQPYTFLFPSTGLIPSAKLDALNYHISASIPTQLV